MPAILDTPTRAATTVGVTDATFDEVVLRSPIPVLVDFWAVWCAPCRSIAPIVEELAEEHTGRLRVAKMDTDANPSWPSRLKIMGIPTFVLFKQGREVGRIVGAAPKVRLAAAIRFLLGPA